MTAAGICTLDGLVGLSGFRCIVADPPWEMDRTPGGCARRKGAKGNAPMPYPMMPLADIEAMPVSGVADKDAHLYLWTVGRFLEAAPSVARAWGFRVVNTLVWCKRRGGFVGGAYFPNVEFCLFCRRGKLPTQRRVNSQWFEWPRGRHSAKPEAFQDMVEAVSPGPRLELFARRARLGWTVWGNEVEAKGSRGAASAYPDSAGSALSQPASKGET